MPLSVCNTQKMPLSVPHDDHDYYGQGEIIINNIIILTQAQAHNNPSARVDPNSPPLLTFHSNVCKQAEREKHCL